ncbi:hypothetical protein RFI_31538 [Reticulomyxa filosa]|uniref:Uncharacterized protein n=1 Tax=Reticulomyxa filosa TaxID=46433 RepID=X6LVB2_RETFI|nr:hypothetical protein RFI_31538 [Reticulomyxa filosa]|eukprot:ETO05858.1 hypothetical protein RFI_31538 [Reticulomyxa filosa]
MFKYFFLNQNTSKYLLKTLFNQYSIPVFLFTIKYDYNTAKLFKIYKKQYKIEIFETIRKDYLGKGKVLQKDFYFIQYLDMEDEILFFLKNPSVEMKQEQAEALCKVLRDDQNCKSVEDVVKQTETDCEDVVQYHQEHIQKIKHSNS